MGGHTTPAAGQRAPAEFGYGRSMRFFTSAPVGSMAMRPPVTGPPAPVMPPVMRPITWALVSVVIWLQPSWSGTYKRPVLRLYEDSPQFVPPAKFGQTC